MRRYENWKKASASGADDNCVQVATAADGTIGVRDSKKGDRSAVLEFSPAEWSAFTDGVRGGEFD